jgi:SAM-dependent methyltransferase
MAVWLADRVGPTGRVVATDVDLTYLSRLEAPNLEVRRHDILEDPLEVLDPGSFDVVCSRLMLFWLAGQQEAAIDRMVRCLRPGGWLLDEDGDWGLAGPADLSSPSSAPYDRVYRHGGWWEARGYDPFFGRKLPDLFERCGLQRIAHRATATVVPGGSPWARWWAATLDAIRGWGLAAGDGAESSERDHEAMIESCLDPSVWFMTQLLHACAGQRPES